MLLGIGLVIFRSHKKREVSGQRGADYSLPRFANAAVCRSNPPRQESQAQHGQAAPQSSPRRDSTNLSPTWPTGCPNLRKQGSPLWKKFAKSTFAGSTKFRLECKWSARL